MIEADKKLLNDIQGTILSSEQFKNSKNSKSLLEYLMQCSINDISPKEVTIAQEVFHKDENFIPGEDPLVRVHIHNLRKKLEDYYNNEGKTDKYIIEIPKGNYVIKVTERDFKKEKKPFGSRIKPVNIALLICILIIAALSVLFYRSEKQLNYYQIVDEKDPIWGSFMSKDKESVIVCGDHFYYNYPIMIDKRSVHIRDTWINSKEEMGDIIFPKDKSLIRAADQTYFPYSTIWSLAGIIKVLNSVPRQFVLRRASKLTPNLIDEQNIVYIGNNRSLGILSNYISEADLKINNRDRIIYNFSDNDTTTFITEFNEDMLHKDYVTIIKIRAPRGNTIILISSFFTVGVKEAVHFLSDKDMLKVVENNLVESCGYMPNSFKIIIEVMGIKQAIVESSKFVLIESLDTKQFPPSHTTIHSDSLSNGQ